MKVSIFTPTHDTQFLGEAYLTLKDQTCQDWEWVVLHNNGAEQIDFGDARVKSVVVKSFPGWVGALKGYACGQCSGDVLLELDHDDLLAPTAVAEVLAAFEADPEVGFVYSNAMRVGANYEAQPRFGEEFGWRYRQTRFHGRLLDETISFEPTPEAVSRIWFAPDHLRAFRRSAYEAAGGYNGEMRVLDDQDLMCRLYLVTKFKHLDLGLYVYRIHGENAWLRHNQEIQENVYRLYDQYIERMVLRLDGRKLDLGGQFACPSGFESVDKQNASVIADLNERWPFDDSSVAVIRAYDVFEHLRDPVHTMKECYRVLRPGGWVIGQVLSTDGRGAFQDPTHVSFWNENSFLYYTNQNWARYIGTPVRFQAPRLWTTPKDMNQVCWVRFNLLSLKDGYWPPGLIEI